MIASKKARIENVTDLDNPTYFSNIAVGFIRNDISQCFI